jgi:hypothetical protein
MNRSWIFVLAAAALLLQGAAAQGQDQGGDAQVEAAAACPAVPSGIFNQAPTSPLFTFDTYASFGAQYGPANLGSLGFPGGLGGKFSAFGEQAEFVLRSLSSATLPAPSRMQKNMKAMSAACKKGACIKSLQSFQAVYASLAPHFQPALANFAFSDATFARMRLTVGPMLIKAVPTMGALPFSPRSITGLSKIIASTGAAGGCGLQWPGDSCSPGAGTRHGMRSTPLAPYIAVTRETLLSMRPLTIRPPTHPPPREWLYPAQACPWPSLSLLTGCLLWT